MSVTWFPEEDRDALRRSIEAKLNDLVEVAKENKLVITVEQVNLMPPAMGNYKTVIEVRDAR